MKLTAVIRKAVRGIKYKLEPAPYHSTPVMMLYFKAIDLPEVPILNWMKSNVIMFKTMLVDQRNQIRFIFARIFFS